MLPLDGAAVEPRAGGKAATLARARAAGFAVPDGIVALPGETVDEAALAEALRRLGGERFAVRSSATLEDLPDRSAAGLFRSELEVPASEVAGAIARVRASARSPSVRSYLGGHGEAGLEIAVLIQPMVAASLLGVLHLTDAGAAAEERPLGEPEWGDVTPRFPVAGDPLVEGARRLAALVGLGGGADVEYALTARGPVFLQARPLTAAPTPPPVAWDPGDDGEWIRDAEHNPDPLSRAQADLVALVEGLPGVPRQRVLAGYLYFCRAGAAPPVELIPPSELPQRFVEEIAPACGGLLAPLERGEAPPLAVALAAYRDVAVRYFGLLGPSLRRARGLLDQLLSGGLGERLRDHADLLAGTGEIARRRDQLLHRLGLADPASRPALLEEYNRRYGAYSPAWEVAVPTDAELPTRVLGMAALLARGPAPEGRREKAAAIAEAAATRVRRRLDRMSRGTFDQLLPVVRSALAVAEADDALFFRAQAVVRRVLFAHGLLLHGAGRLDDPSLVFHLPLALLQGGEPSAGDLAAAAVASARRESLRGLLAPTVITGRRPSYRAGGSGRVLRGAGTRGRGQGRAFVLLDPAAAPPALPEQAVLVVPAILPSLTYLIPGAAALVTDHGGALSHGATLAREYGVPAVLGCGRATRLLVDGEALLVDADSGRVLRLGDRAGDEPGGEPSSDGPA